MPRWIEASYCRGRTFAAAAERAIAADRSIAAERAIAVERVRPVVWQKREPARLEPAGSA